MTGVEAVAGIVGLVSDCISLTKIIIDIGKAANDNRGLPKKLRDLFDELPHIKDVFEQAQKNSNSNLNDERRKHAELTLQKCKSALQELEVLFIKVCPEDDADRFKRVCKATSATVLGRNSKLQQLWEQINGYLNTLEKEEIFVIGDKLNDMKDAIASLAEEDGGKNVNYGSGPQNNAEGDQNNQGGGTNNKYTQNIQGGGNGNNFTQHIGST